MTNENITSPVAPSPFDDTGLRKISQYLSQAIFLEVVTHPKPGMVTRLSNGAHRDMSILTFAMSSAVLSRAFHDFFDMGCTYEGAPENLLSFARGRGIAAERELLAVTKGVNTQRGILFSGGLIALAAGYTLARGGGAASLIPTVRHAAAGIVARELGSKKDSTLTTGELLYQKGGALTAGELLCQKDGTLTAGELLYQKYGITGIRGEAERGFPSVMEKGLHALYEAFRRGTNLNDALVHTVISLMTIAEDTNVIWRAGFGAAEYVKDTARGIIDAGSIFTKAGWEKIHEAEEDFVKKRISPGGSADLLSVTIALYLVENGNFPGHIM